MFHTMIMAKPDLTKGDEQFFLPSIVSHIDKHITHFNVIGTFDTGKQFAEFTNSIQALARAQPWAIPVTISTDPRHAFNENPQLANAAGPFSQWPEPIGLAALPSPKLQHAFYDTVRRDYLAVGLRGALHPQADLATEPRWSRTAGSMGEDAEVASTLCAAAVRGLQGDVLGPASISACVKHFPGGGPAKNGLDPHFAWGAEQVYPGDGWEYHLKPFRAAVDAGVNVVMPSYGKPMGTKFPEIAMAFNKPVMDVLRNDLGFDGVILSDWLILKDMPHPEILGDLATARAWGLEHLTPEERVVRALEAGIDQFGGDHDVTMVINVVKDGRVPESRIDESVRRILKNKFVLGLFDQPLVDAEAADTLVGTPEDMAAGYAAQKDAVTLLKNAKLNSTGLPLLPLPAGTKVYTEGFKQAIPLAGVTTVESPAEANVAVVRLKTPWTPTGQGPFARSFHHGPLEFPQDVLDHIHELSQKVPVVVEIFADRPPVLGTIDRDAAAVMLSYGLCEQGLSDVLFGYSPKGKLPFDLPRSDEAIQATKSDTPFDSKDPVYRYGHGLTYA